MTTLLPRGRLRATAIGGSHLARPVAWGLVGLLVLVTLVAVLGMHASVLSVTSASPAMAGMTAAGPVTMADSMGPGDALASAGTGAASMVMAASAAAAPLPGGPTGSMPGGHHQSTMAAACAVILSAMVMALLAAPARARFTALRPGAGASQNLSRRADRWAVGVPIPLGLCVSRT